MTRNTSSPDAAAAAAAPLSPASNTTATARRWPLQDAKARFSELVRRVHSDGPQHVTVHGRDEVVVVAVEAFRRLAGGRSGQALVDALAASPHRDIEFVAPAGDHRSPVRDVPLP